MRDPFVVAAALGLCASIVAGKALVRLVELSPPRWHRRTLWLCVGGAGLVAIVTGAWSDGPSTASVSAFVLAALPGTVAFLVWRTVFASVLVSLLPLYFGIGALTVGRTLHLPALALDRAIPVEPAWMIVYGSIYVFALLPVAVVRDAALFRRVLQTAIVVVLVSYLGFLLYPTIAPRPAHLLEAGFFAWSLRLTYALDSPYNCFPSLHVAHSFVSALACYRVHRGVGIAAVMWAGLIGVSTLFTKQHFAVDVVAGALLAWIGYAVFLRSYPRTSVPEPDRRLAPRRALAAIAVFVALVAVLWVMYRTGTVVV